VQVVDQLQERDDLFEDVNYDVYLKGYPEEGTKPGGGDDDEAQFVDARSRMASLRSFGSFGSARSSGRFYDAPSAPGSFMSGDQGAVRFWPPFPLAIAPCCLDRDATATHRPRRGRSCLSGAAGAGHLALMSALRRTGWLRAVLRRMQCAVQCECIVLCF
jgi:hypothetical protein